MPLPPTSDLALAITAATLTPLPDEPWYRSVDLAVVVNLGVHVLDGTHTGKTGGRFNSPASKPTCYLAGTQTLAAFECEQAAMILGLTKPRSPRVTFAISVAGAQVLDLTNALVRTPFGLTYGELTLPSSHWQHLNRTGVSAPVQILGEAARARKDCDGLVVPSWLCSVLPPGTLPRPNNLVLFMDPGHSTRLRNTGRTITVHDHSKLLYP